MKLVGLILVLFLELWLGKTSKVQAGSILELLYNIASGRGIVPPPQPEQEKKDGQGI